MTATEICTSAKKATGLLTSAFPENLRQPRGMLGKILVDSLLTASLVRGQFVQMLVGVRQGREDLRQRQRAAGKILRDLFGRHPAFVLRQHILDADPRARDAGLAEANLGVLRDVIRAHADL